MYIHTYMGTHSQIYYPRAMINKVTQVKSITIKNYTTKRDKVNIRCMWLPPEYHGMLFYSDVFL